MEQHVVTEDNAALVWMWLKTRGGIAVWESVNLSNFGTSWTTPLNDAQGQPKSKPTWEAGNQPIRIITDPAEVVISKDAEVKRFRVAVRMGSQGLMLKVTDAGTRRIRAAVEKAGKGAYYRFDYETQEAVIYAPTRAYTPISEYIEAVKP